MYTKKFKNKDTKEVINHYIEENPLLDKIIDELAAYYRDVSFTNLEKKEDDYLISFSTSSLSMNELEEESVYNIQYLISNNGAFLDCVSINKGIRTLNLMEKGYLLTNGEKNFQIIMDFPRNIDLNIIKWFLDENTSITRIRDILDIIRSFINIENIGKITIKDNTNSEMVLENGYFVSYVEYLNQVDCDVRIILIDKEFYLEKIYRSKIEHNYKELIKK